MHFAEIFFEDPRLSMQWDKIRGIAADWRRVFPKLRGMPCPADVHYMQEDGLNKDSEGDRASVDAVEEMSDLDEESEGDSMSADEGMSLSEPGLDFDNYGSDWFILRTKLWKVLSYPVIHEKIQYSCNPN